MTELTVEQKNYISSLAGGTPQYSVGQLSQIRDAFLAGIEMEVVKKLFSQDMEEEKMEQLKKELLENKKEKNEKLFNDMEIEKDTEKDRVSGKDMGTSEGTMDMSEILAMAKDAVRQLNEVKIKYEVMDEFIHKHILEEKNKEIVLLKEENKRLKEEIKNAIRAAPEKKAEIIDISKKETFKFKKIKLPKFLKHETEQNYMLHLLSNPKFTAEQIAEIRLGLEADLDEVQIKSYAKQEISARQMKEIRMLYELQNQKQKERMRADGNRND